MKKQMLLFRRKGFTLIECLIAIAVFGAMTMIVFMILTHARTQTVEANKSEEDLSNLIENVMGDETYKRYNAANHVGDNDVLSLVVDDSSISDSFKVSYNVIDGNKNFVKCPNAACGYYANNTDFMLEPDVNGTFKSVSKTDFEQGDKYICPKCQEEFYDNLLCEDCAASGARNDTNKFSYLTTTGGYVCKSCGGTAVRHTSYSDGTATGDASMSVSGIVPNAIRYGKVDPKSVVKSGVTVERKTEDLFKYNNSMTGGGEIYFSLSYAASTNSSLPGTYTLTIRGADVPADATDGSGYYEMVVDLPPHYVVKNFQKASGSAELSNLVNGDSSSQNCKLCLKTNMNGNSQFTFQLVNYKSGFSFEYDYNDTSDSSECGLAGYWFGVTPSSISRDDADYVKTSSASATVNCLVNP